ncbi:hypothetical protein [Homoserinibacter sp. GY 40078]|uniref:hypothetical protein n=1 Tax=Homoserinibacter sp. GY 40078 TaxID=2603275 RepID=UPI0011CBF94E|nr:hypothetical protein [Homoserinibacter sp. GY 40078]TXK17185.1 hypothetical protein FVQ89_10005 [Homoserinibacter sp. GY 40078]
MKRALKVGIAAATAGILTMAVAAPAQADPWDGDDIDYGLGIWGFYDGRIEDVYLKTSGEPEYTDIWDGMGQVFIAAADAGIDDELVDCPSDEATDVSIDDVTGDFLLTCTSEAGVFEDAGLTVKLEVRIYADSDLVRVSTTIENTTAEPVDIDGVGFYTDFGTSGSLWGYQGQDDAVLPVPADETEESGEALAAAGARWAVHYNDYDAPGGLAWGSAGASAPASLDYLDGDEYLAVVSGFTVPAGASRTVAYFALWNPQLLIDLGYTNDPSEVQETAADALVPSMSEFDTFSGRLATGLSNVVNWSVVADEEEEEEPAAAPAAESEDPELADTGVDDVALGLGAAALLALLGSAAIVVSRTRQRRATR